jgi:hypothetical protein
MSMIVVLYIWNYIILEELYTLFLRTTIDWYSLLSGTALGVPLNNGEIPT